MNKLLRDMDLLKATILSCLVASAGLGIWNYTLTGALDRAQRAWRRAKTDIIEIHSLGKQIQTLYRARDDQGGNVQVGVYFENQLTEFGGIPLKAYALRKKNEKPVVIGRNKAVDTTQEIDFRTRGRTQKIFLPRQNLFRALYNCERNSKRWKLRELSIRSKDDMDPKRKKDDGYPAELADEWFVEKLVFASREPKTK